VLQLGEVLHDLWVGLEGARDFHASSNLLVLSVVVGQTAEVSVWFLDVLDEVGELQSVPQANNGSASLLLGGVEDHSVVDKKGLEDVGEDRESEDCSGIAKNSDNGNEALNDMVVKSRRRDSSIDILEDVHEHEVVVTNVLVLAALLSFQNVSVDELVVGIDYLQRQLSEGVVDSVVVHGPVSDVSDDSDGGGEELLVGGKGICIEASVAVEGVSLVVSGVGEGG